MLFSANYANAPSPADVILNNIHGDNGGAMVLDLGFWIVLTPPLYYIGMFARPLIGAGFRAAFGRATTNNYRQTFFESFPHLRGEVVVHHAVERQALIKYPGVVAEAEIHSLQNLRGIPKALNPEVHLSKIRLRWRDFYRTHANPTKRALLHQATLIDNEFGHLFRPRVR